jgi:two-component sensor histidine kinase
LLAPYDDLGAFSGRIRVSVPRMGVGERAATALAMVLHELATNSLKYGALSSETGTLDVSCDSPEKDVAIVWTERGGPPVTAPQGRGYGTSLISKSMSQQFGGSVDYHWDEGGLVVTLRTSLERLAE